MSEFNVLDRVKINKNYGAKTWGDSDGSMEEMIGLTGTVTQLGLSYHTVTMDEPHDGSKEWLFEPRELDLI